MLLGHSIKHCALYNDGEIILDFYKGFKHFLIFMYVF